MFRIWLSIAVAGVALAAIGAAQADRGVRPAESVGPAQSIARRASGLSTPQEMSCSVSCEGDSS